MLDKDYILISPWSRKLPSGKKNPKDYPYWPTVVSGLPYHVIQVGVTGEESLTSDCRFSLSLIQVSELIVGAKIWISVDNFCQHLAWYLGKPGIVLFGQSDPNIFGHPENINLYKNKKYFRNNQFGTWEEAVYKSDVFVAPQLVLSTVARHIGR